MRIIAALAITLMLAACAPGGGIGLVALMNDSACKQQGFQLGTPEYANCRANLQQQAMANNAAMQAFYQRQQEQATQRLNQQQTCSSNGVNNGGITSGTMTCQ